MEETFRLIDAVPDMGRHNTIRGIGALLKLLVVAAAVRICGWVVTARFAAEHHDLIVGDLGQSPRRPPSPRTVARAAALMPCLDHAVPEVPRPTSEDGSNAPSASPPPLVAIDGKVLRGSRRRKGSIPEKVVFAVNRYGRTIGAEPLGSKESPSGKEGEIPAALRLITRVCAGRLVIMDALFCFPTAASSILDAGGHYAISCKVGMRFTHGVTFYGVS